MARGKYQKRRNKAPILFWAALLFLSAMLIISVWYLADYFIGSRQQANEYDDLAALVDSLRPTVGADSRDPDSPTAATLPEELPVPTPAADIYDENGILLEYAPLYARNPDMAGWLSIEGTRINYPVMHTPGRANYYIDHNFDGQYSSWGCIYAREECNLLEPSDNVTLYGHNMKDGSMFAGLKAYLSRDFWQAHRYIRFDTLSEHHVYEIFAVFTTTATEGQGFAYHDFINAVDEPDFDTFIAKCLSNSLYGTDLVPVYGDKIICLSTCEYTQENGRLVVAAMRIS